MAMQPCRDFPCGEQPRAGQDRRQAGDRCDALHQPSLSAGSSSRRLVHQPLDADHVILVAAIEQERGAVARPRQLDRNDLFHAAGRARDHHDTVGQEHRLFDAVGDEQHGLAVTLPDRQQIVLQARARMGVERAEWFVHQQDARLVGERARDRDPLLHAAGELLGIEVLVAGEMHHGEELAHARLRLRLRDALLFEPVHDVAEHRLPGKQTRIPGTPARDRGRGRSPAGRPPSPTPSRAPRSRRRCRAGSIFHSRRGRGRRRTRLRTHAGRCR